MGADTSSVGLNDESSIRTRHPLERRPLETQLYPVGHLMSRQARAERHGHHGGVVWLTGLSGAGKSTIAMRLELLLFERGWQTYALDGDNVRHGLCHGLGFSAEDRSENVRRLGEVAALFADAGAVAIVSAISPYRLDRERAREATRGKFCEVFVKASLDVCERRDPKGLYRKARARQLPGFTGISSPYEPPLCPDLTLDTEQTPPEASSLVLCDHVSRHFSL